MRYVKHVQQSVMKFFIVLVLASAIVAFPQEGFIGGTGVIQVADNSDVGGGGSGNDPARAHDLGFLKMVPQDPNNSGLEFLLQHLPDPMPL
ncbi:unnamed protein product [Allacma fusca]|uniref:Uncharacterized protein n=1 Tax=Allacma fusca TaxID=39272 RepID=A0A8J2L905_9HEXA|nr:unnamed protein product [Allacma fusca]